MLYAKLLNSTSVRSDYAGHVGDESLQKSLNFMYDEIAEIQADGDELQRCCDLLGRALPPVRVYTFIGTNAQEIARNWYA